MGRKERQLMRRSTEVERSRTETEIGNLYRLARLTLSAYRKPKRALRYIGGRWTFLLSRSVTLRHTGVEFLFVLYRLVATMYILNMKLKRKKYDCFVSLDSMVLVLIIYKFTKIVLLKK